MVVTKYKADDIPASLESFCSSPAFHDDDKLFSCFSIPPKSDSLRHERLTADHISFLQDIPTRMDESIRIPYGLEEREEQGTVIRRKRHLYARGGLMLVEEAAGGRSEARQCHALGHIVPGAQWSASHASRALQMAADALKDDC